RQVQPVAAEDRGGWAGDPWDGGAGRGAVLVGGKDRGAGGDFQLLLARDGRGAAVACGAEAAARGEAAGAPDGGQGGQDECACSEASFSEQGAGGGHAAGPAREGGCAGGWGGAGERSRDPVRCGGARSGRGGALSAGDGPLRDCAGGERSADAGGGAGGGAVEAALRGGAGTRCSAAEGAGVRYGRDIGAARDGDADALCRAAVAGRGEWDAGAEAGDGADGRGGIYGRVGRSCDERAQLRGDGCGSAGEAAVLAGTAGRDVRKDRSD